jgi:hypothetical protein
LKEAMERRAAEGVDDGTNDLSVSDVIRRYELQVWSWPSTRRYAAGEESVAGTHLVNRSPPARRNRRV